MVRDPDSFFGESPMIHFPDKKLRSLDLWLPILAYLSLSFFLFLFGSLLLIDLSLLIRLIAEILSLILQPSF